MTHPTITNMQAMQVARGIGAIVEAGLAPVFYSHHQLHLFAQDVYKLGRNAGLEEAKQLVVKLDGMIVNLQPHEITTSLESLKDNTP